MKKIESKLEGKYPQFIVIADECNRVPKKVWKLLLKHQKINRHFTGTIST